MGILFFSLPWEDSLCANTFAVGITAASLCIRHWQLSHLFIKPNILIFAQFSSSPIQTYFRHTSLTMISKRGLTSSGLGTIVLDSKEYRWISIRLHSVSQGLLALGPSPRSAMTLWAHFNIFPFCNAGIASTVCGTG